MKIISYSAISIDGYIATPGGDSKWVSKTDIPYFENEIRKAGCIIVGRKTFELFEGEIYPVKGVLNIVLSSKPRKRHHYPNVLFSSKPPKAIVKLIRSKGFKSALLVGGGKTNGSFLKAGLVNEIIVDVHPLVLGKGIKIFETGPKMLNCKKVSLSKLPSGLVLIRYEVKKK